MQNIRKVASESYITGYQSKVSLRENEYTGKNAKYQSFIENLRNANEAKEKADTESKNGLTKQDMMDVIRAEINEISEKLKDKNPEPTYQIGANSFTEKEWNQLIKEIDESQEELKEIMEEEKEIVEEKEYLEELFERKAEENEVIKMNYYGRIL